ncbi:hypothetical protein ACI2OX_07640 [Bacillus sp. N9]
MKFSIILLFMIVQDWVPLGSLNDIQAISAARSFNELVIVTMIGVVQILLLMGLVLIFMGKRYPIWIKLWLIIHQACIFAGVLIDWWIPYFLDMVLSKEQRITIKCSEIHIHSSLKCMELFQILCISFFILLYSSV